MGFLSIYSCSLIVLFDHLSSMYTPGRSEVLDGASGLSSRSVLENESCSIYPVLSSHTTILYYPIECLGTLKSRASHSVSSPVRTKKINLTFQLQ